MSRSSRASTSCSPRQGSPTAPAHRAAAPAQALSAGSRSALATRPRPRQSVRRSLRHRLAGARYRPTAGTSRSAPPWSAEQGRRCDAASADLRAPGLLQRRRISAAGSMRREISCSIEVLRDRSVPRRPRTRVAAACESAWPRRATQPSSSRPRAHAFRARGPGLRAPRRSTARAIVRPSGSSGWPPGSGPAAPASPPCCRPVALSRRRRRYARKLSAARRYIDSDSVHRPSKTPGPPGCSGISAWRARSPSSVVRVQREPAVRQVLAAPDHAWMSASPGRPGARARLSAESCASRTATSRPAQSIGVAALAGTGRSA